MIADVDTAEFRRNAGDLLVKVRSLQDSIVIRENGQPVAALVDAETYRRILWERLDKAVEPLRSAYGDIPEETGLSEIERICSEVRHS